MIYKINFIEAAEKDLHKLSKKVAKSIILKIWLFLEVNPWPHGKNLKNLQGKENCYRLRISDYRVLYKIQGDQVIIFSVGHRREVYR